MNGLLPSPAGLRRGARFLAIGLFALAGVLEAEAAVAQAEAPPAPSAPAPAAPEAPAEPAAPAPLPPPPLAESPLVRPTIDVSVPAPLPPVERRMHHHDGFYLRVNAGAGYRGASVSSESTAHADYTLNGAGISLDLLVGGTPSPGLAIGGGLMLDSVADGDVEVDGAPNVGSGSGGLLLVGAFVDGFPMANRGFHLGALAGLAGGGFSRKGEDDEFSGGGLGAAVWIGHGFWVAPDWTLGFDLKVGGAALRDNSGDADMGGSMYGFSLSFSALYH